MAIRITAEAKFWAPAGITIPGNKEAAVIDVEWRHKGRQALQAWVKGFGERTDVEVLDEVIADWKGVDGKNGAEPYSKEALAQILDSYPTAAGELMDAYVKELSQSKAKN